MRAGRSQDNIDTDDLPTTGGAPLFACWVPLKDAIVTARLRAAGAVILAMYGCGDFINDYEGIIGYDEYRDDLRLMYFPSIAVRRTYRLLETALEELGVDPSEESQQLLSRLIHAPKQPSLGRPAVE